MQIQFTKNSTHYLLNFQRTINSNNFEVYFNSKKTNLSKKRRKFNIYCFLYYFSCIIKPHLLITFFINNFHFFINYCYYERGEKNRSTKDISIHSICK